MAFVAIATIVGCLPRRSTGPAEAKLEACRALERAGELEKAEQECLAAVAADPDGLAGTVAAAELRAIRLEMLALDAGTRPPRRAAPACTCADGDPLCGCSGGGPPPIPASVSALVAWAQAPASARSPVPPSFGPNLLADPLPMVRAFEKKLGGGGVRALELVIHAGYATLQAQDPKKKENVDSYEYAASAVKDPSPVRLYGPAARSLEPNLFGLDEVDFAKLPSLVGDTRARLGIEDGEVSHAILGRDLIDSALGWRVYVIGTRKDGYVRYDAKGVFVRTYGAASAPAPAGSPKPLANPGRPAPPLSAPPPKKKVDVNPCRCASGDLNCSINCSASRKPSPAWSPRAGDVGF